MLHLPSVWLVHPPPSDWLSSNDTDTDSDDDLDMETRRGQRASKAPQVHSVPENDLPAEAATQSLADDELEDNSARKPIISKPNRAVTTGAMGLDNTQLPPSMSALSRHSSGQLSDAAVKGHLKVFLADKIHRDYPVVDFVKAVWGLGADELKKPQSPNPKDYVLNATACRQYISRVYDKKDKLKSGVERSAYAPLMKIFRDLEKQIKGAYNIKDPDHKLSIVNMKDRKVVGQFAGLKPDIIWGWADEQDQQYWDMSALVGELKKGIIPESVSKSFPVFQISLNAFPSFEYGESKDEPSTSTGKRKASAVPTTTRRSKRLRSDSQAGGESGTAENAATPASPADTLSTARAPVPLTPKELQIAKYLNELASHGVRSYATGVLIEDCDMTLWYMDRMGVVKSTSFNFLKEPHFLLLFIAAITIAPLTRLGFFPMLRFPGTFPDDYRDATLELPPVLDANGDTQSGLQFDVDITDARKIINTYGAVGRATVVVPVRSSNESSETCCGSVNLMVKISWQSHQNEGEDAHIRAIRSAVAAEPSAKEYLKHIIDLKCSVTRSMKEMGLPRAFMHDLRTYHERVCRTLVLVEYMPLNLINSPEEFKTVFVGALRGHHAAYVSASILHRDVSTNNIMFYRNPDHTAVGVMCDWDLGAPCESLDSKDMFKDIIGSQIYPNKATGVVPQSQPPAVTKQPTSQQSSIPHPSGVIVQSEPEPDSPNRMPKYRTGTGPFMALDLLLYLQAPHHQYRHDLESFFWILAWFVVSFNPEKQTLGTVDAWLKNNLGGIGTAKAAFLSQNATRKKIMSSMHATYEDICEEWLDKLRLELIYPVYRMFSDFDGELFERWEKATLKNPPNEDRIKRAEQAIYELVDSREKILTYEVFMKCLGEKP